MALGSPSHLGTFRDSGDFTGILREIQAPQVWDFTKGAGTTIVVIDSGIDGKLVPLRRRAGQWPGEEAWIDTVGHGSMIAMIAGASRNYNGYDGVAPEARLFSVKPKTGPSGGILGTSVLQALDYVLGLAQEIGPVIVCHAWGVYGCTAPEVVCHVIPTRLVQAINQGGITVWAAGNARGMCPQDSKLVWCLNSSPNSISVGALTRSLVPQGYSSPGPGQCSPEHPTVMCPTYGTLPWGIGFRDFGRQGGGTSSCVPQVAGTLALLLSMHPKATVQELRHALVAGASQTRLGRAPGYNTETGHGLLQAKNSMDALMRGGDELKPQVPKLLGRTRRYLK